MNLRNITSMINPFFDWIQVEITSYCNAKCSYCPNSILRDYWDKRHMSIETFKRISTYFPRQKSSTTIFISFSGFAISAAISSMIYRR